MAVHSSAAKRHRQSLKRRARNRAVKTRARTLLKKARQAVEARDLTGASAQLKEVHKALRKAVSKGILKSNTASRWLSRLARSVHRLQAAAKTSP